MSYNWTVEVLNTNRAPEITDFSPSTDSVSVDLDSMIVFNINALDLDNDSLSYSWFIDEVEQDSVEHSFSYLFNTVGLYQITGVVSDGIASDTAFCHLTVIDNSGIDQNNLPIVTKLYQNYPNPFNPETTIQFDLDKTENVKIGIYNSKGELVSTLVNNRYEAGRYFVKWSTSFISSGIYYYYMSAGKYKKIKKMIMVK